MNEIVVSEEQILKAEAIRVELRDDLRSKGYTCADDEPLNSLVAKAKTIQPVNRALDKTVSGELYLPNVLSLIAGQFKNCVALTKVIAPNTTTFEGSDVFNGCTLLNEIDVSELIGNTRYSAFTNCSNLKSLDLNKVTTLAYQCFMGCTALEKLDIRKVTVIESGVFIDCLSLKEISAPLNTGTAEAISKNNNALEIVDYGSPTNMNFLRDNADSTRYNWEYLILRTTSMVTLSAVTRFRNSKFSDVNGNGKLYVPANLVSTYENGTNWSALASLTVIDLVGSRFENTNWQEHLTETCTLDGVTRRVLDTETADIFKHTENVEHIYENGVEITGSTLVKDKELTTG